MWFLSFAIPRAMLLLLSCRVTCVVISLMPLSQLIPELSKTWAVMFLQSQCFSRGAIIKAHFCLFTLFDNHMCITFLFAHCTSSTWHCNFSHPSQCEQMINKCFQLYFHLHKFMNKNTICRSLYRAALYFRFFSCNQSITWAYQNEALDFAILFIGCKTLACRLTVICLIDR